MPRGAPKGNQYARKDASKKREGSSVTLYLDGYTTEFLQAACKLDGQEPTLDNARKRAKTLAKKAIDADVRRTFLDPRLAKMLDIDAAPE